MGGRIRSIEKSNDLIYRRIILDGTGGYYNLSLWCLCVPRFMKAKVLR
jgi:hypothetical protein